MYPRLLVSVAVFCWSTAAEAQDFTTTGWVFLRRSPSMSGARLRELPPNDTLSLRNVPPRNAFVPVRTKDGLAGWVGKVYLRDLRFTGSVAAATLNTKPGGGAFVAIDTAWGKPPIDTLSIPVKGGAQVCHPTGDGTDDGTDLHKNRADVPASSYLITIDAIRSLPDTALWRYTGRSHWTRQDSALVIPFEGIPVTVEGYFEIVKPQSTTAPKAGKKVGESTNCHSWDEKDTDWHIALVADPSEHEEQAVVVEPTPRTKRHNAGWTPQAATALAVRHSPSDTRHEAEAQRVRVTGFLMLDPVHPTHIRGGCALHHCSTPCCFRATLWEVHPVTRIEVRRGDQWIDLNNLNN
jgi:hypothetical protein